MDPILTRTGGAYIPPAKLRMMQEQITDKNRWVESNILEFLLKHKTEEDLVTVGENEMPFEGCDHSFEGVFLSEER